MGHLTVVCPACGQSGRLDEAAVPTGRAKVKCPGCHETFAFAKELQAAAAGSIVPTVAPGQRVRRPAAAPPEPRVQPPRPRQDVRASGAEPSRKVLLIVGVLLGTLGCFPLLAVLGMAPGEVYTHGAPLWVIGGLVASFPTVGWMLFSKAAADSLDESGHAGLAAFFRHVQGIFGLAFLGCFVGGLAIFLNIQAFGGGTGPSSTTLTIAGIRVPLSGWVATAVDRGFIGLMALCLDAIIVMGVVVTVKTKLGAKGTTGRGKQE